MTGIVLDYMNKANCPLVGPMPAEGVPSMGGWVLGDKMVRGKHVYELGIT